LRENGFDESEVVVVHPDDLEKMVGPETEIVAIGGHDLLGINPPTSEFVELAATGPPYNRVKFLELLESPALRDVNVVVGGKSAWQVADERVMDRLGIDYVHIGEGERSIPEMFSKILNGEEVPRIVEGEEVPVEDIPNLRGWVIYGLVEIMRGCGRGCKFCTPGMQKLRHKPIDHILRDVKTNLEAGAKNIGLHSEDVLRYGTYEIAPNREKVLELFKKVSDLNGVKAMGTSHVALATVYHNPDLVRDVSEIFHTLPEQERIGTQTGIETGSPRLMEKHMRGKALPSSPEKWPEIVDQSLGLLDDNNWTPACTLINGLPGETRDDAAKTLELLDEIKNHTALIVPLNFVSMEGSSLSKENSLRAEGVYPEHWQILGECMEHDAEIARSLKSDKIRGNVLIKWLFEHFSDYLIKGAEKYAEGMKAGNPPKNYSEISEDYTVPEVLKTE
ncbi:hypothetical protein AKJ48_03705, partial [candidate division MSBL1 archaeon SCGC-AAA261O19]